MAGRQHFPVGFRCSRAHSPFCDRCIDRFVDRAATVQGEIRSDVRCGMSETEAHRLRLRCGFGSDLTEDVIVIDRVDLEEVHDPARCVRTVTPWTSDSVGDVGSDRGDTDEPPGRSAIRASSIIRVVDCAAVHSVQHLLLDSVGSVRRLRRGRVEQQRRSNRHRKRRPRRQQADRSTTGPDLRSRASPLHRRRRPLPHCGVVAAFAAHRHVCASAPGPTYMSP